MERKKPLDKTCKLLEAGFEYVTDMNGAKLFRKKVALFAPS